MMPNPIEDIIRLLKISPGADRFLVEVHPKLRPVETAVPGVVLAGTAQGPMNIQESCAAASAAAAKVAVLLSQGQVELEPFVARVDPDRCDGSGQCVEVCCYEDAITLQTVSYRIGPSIFKSRRHPRQLRRLRLLCQRLSQPGHRPAGLDPGSV